MGLSAQTTFQEFANTMQNVILSPVVVSLLPVEAQCFNGSVSVTWIDRKCQEGFAGSSVRG